MKQNRRRLLSLLTMGLLMPLLLVAARRGIPGMGRMAEGLRKRVGPQPETQMHGYHEVHLS